MSGFVWPVRIAYATLAAAGALSLAVHLAVAGLAQAPNSEVLLEGGEEIQLAAIGSSFEDLVAAGSQLYPTEIPPDSVDPAKIELEQATPVQPDEVEPTGPFGKVAQPTATPQKRGPAPARPATDPAPIVSNAVATVSEQVPASDEMLAVAPVAPSEVIQAKPDEPVIPIPISRPVRQIDIERAAQAENERKQAAERAERQRQKKAAAAEKKKALAKEAAGHKKANANQNRKKGASTGSQKGKSGKQNAAKGKNKGKAGNAAVSNYPGEVRRDVARTRRKNPGVRGTAHVSFSVTASGGLVSARISRSSGNGRLDKAALSHIRRSAPFPKPPPGAQRSFTIPIQY